MRDKRGLKVEVVKKRVRVLGIKDLSRWLLLPVVAVLALIAPVTAYAQSLTVVGKLFICQCGCTAVLSNCTHSECSVREEMLGLVKQKIDQGRTEEEIVTIMVARYGEKVLSSPPKRGFNLTAWITPFVAIAAGAAVVYMVIKKWVWRGRTVEIKDTREHSSEYDADYEIQLQKELKEFESRGFR